MPKQITQRIALEGGEDFRRGLAALGQAGQEAFKSVKTGIDSVGQTAINLTPMLDKLQKKLQDIGHAGGELKHRLGEATAEVREFGKRILELAALAAPIGAGELAHQIIEAGDKVGELGKLATGLGLTTKAFQENAFAANQADVSTDDFAKGLGRLENKISESYKAQQTLRIEEQKLTDQLNKNKISWERYNEQITELRTSASQQTDVFNSLGIALTNADGSLRNPLQILQRLREEWPRLTEAQRAAYASQLGFSRDRSFLNIMKVNTQQWQHFVEEGRKVAPALTDAEIKAGEKLDEAVKALKSSWDSLYLSMRLAFAPAFTAVIENFTEAIGHHRAGILEYVHTLADQLKPILIDISKLIAGEEVDPHSFVGQFVEAFKDAARDTLQAIGIIKGAWDLFVTAMDYVADLINSIFGTGFTGRALAIVAVIGVLSGAFSAVASVIGVIIALGGVLFATFGVEFAAIEALIATVGAAIGYFFGRKLKEDIDAFPGVVATVIETVKGYWSQFMDGLYNIFTGRFDLIKERFNDFIQAVVNGWNRVKSAIGFGGSESAPQAPSAYAGGGAVFGAGTSTSDSILARLSNGEFVIKAKAVQHYGANFFAALNNMKIPSPAFALGGLVDALAPRIPRYANGGLVAARASSNTPVVFQIGDSKFGPFLAGEETVTKLSRFASGQQLRSAGRKPTWQGQ